MNSERADEPTDPRVRRTRGQLRCALAGLLETKAFARISVHDIAAGAGLNRATFYDHFSDKDALLDSLVGTRFRELVAARGLGFDGCTSALRSLFIGIAEYLDGLSRQPGVEADRARETAIVGVVREMLLDGMRRHRPEADAFTAGSIAWMLYGAAKAWLAAREELALDEAAARAERLAGAMLAAVGSSETRR